MANGVNSALINMQNATNQQKAEENKKTGATKDLDQDMFLKLMMEQLKYQDPLDPMDNTEFLTQQAQFTQVSSLQSIQSSMASFNQYSQAATMIGRDVVLQNPNEEGSYLYGTVDAVNFNGKEATILVSGVEFPLSSVMQVHAKPIEIPDESSSTDSEGT